MYDTCGNKYDEIIEPNGIFIVKTLLPMGHYFIEVVPKFESSYCKDQCPVFTSKYGELGGIQCEKCKKIVKYIEINSIERGFICYNQLDGVDGDNTGMFLMKYAIEHVNSSIIVGGNIRIQIPSPLNVSQLCNKTIMTVITKREKTFQYLIVFVVFVVVFVMVLFIIDYFGYSKNKFCLFEIKIYVFFKCFFF